MKRMIAFSLAIVLVAAGVPALAHEANYPGECDDRNNQERCERNDGIAPAHDRCTGVRDHMWTGDSVVQKSIGFAISEENSVEAYLHASDGEDEGDDEDTQALMPGIVWLETNGFSGLQRTGFECTSPDHEKPSEWQTHADKVLI